MGRREGRWREVRAIDGHRVGVTVGGAGPALVLLHGVGRDRTDFAPVFDELAEAHRVVAIDIEGFGRSEPWGERVTLGSMAAMVRRTLDVLGVAAPVTLLGNSMGGAVALRMAADDPGAVARLVLVSPAGFGREAMFGLRLMTVPVLGRFLLGFDEIVAFVHMRVLFHDLRVGTLALGHESAARMKRRGARRAYLQAIHDLGAWSGIRAGWREEVLTSLAGSRIPTAVLWGDRDGVLPHAHLAAAADALPFAVTRTLAGLGHIPQLEDPAAFLAAVRPLLADREILRGSGGME